MADLLHEVLEDRVLTITLNRPQARNALTVELIVQLHAAIVGAAVRDDVGAVVMTGAGSGFCAGGDVKLMSASPDAAAPASAPEQVLRLGAEMVLCLHRMGKPTIAMLRGAVAGGGMALALGCDLRFADETARFSYAYTRIALSGDFSINYLLQKWLGPTRAREFALSCSTVEAQEAEAWNLITRRVPSDALEAHVYRIARELANGPTQAMARIKANLDFAWENTPDDTAAVEARNFQACREAVAHGEAVRAFLEKRQPNFVNAALEGFQ